MIKMYRISQDGNTLTTVEGLPEFNSKQLYDELKRLQKGFFDSTIEWPPDKSYIEHLQKNYKGASEFMKAVAMAPGSELLPRGLQGGFAVSNDTFYLEYNYKLYRWKRGKSNGMTRVQKWDMETNCPQCYRKYSFIPC